MEKQFKNKKTIAIHQPNYLPWLGYFYKIYASDIFIFHDNVEHTKKGLTRRTYIRSTPQSSQKKYLSVPLEKQSDFTLIKNLKISHSSSWIQKQKNLLFNTYGKSPFYQQTIGWLFPKLDEAQDIEYLATLNISLIQTILQKLNIQTEIYASSNLKISGEKSAYNIKLIKHFEGKVYLSGTGAKKYQSDEAFQNENITLQYNQLFSYINDHPYLQYQGEFINGLSIVDALFNIGPEAIIDIFNAYSIHQNQNQA